MHVLALAAPSESRDAAAATLRDALAEAGRVGVVTAGSLETPDHDTYTVDGAAWRGSGSGGGLTDALDRLARDHDYALLVGFPDTRFPTVSVGADTDVDDPLVDADALDDLDPASVVDALDDTEPLETLDSLVADLKRHPDAEYAGAVATFTGRVRAKEGPDDDPTTELTFEKYAGVAADRLDAIRDDLTDREGVIEVAFHHRVGPIPYGDDIVYVAVLAAHRREAFRAVEDGIDRLKGEVPIFKKEVTVGDEFWVHDR
ncbi:molybdopterin synthase [Halocalculus aciditolerans]|uniref:Molybdopterin synthase n=1 Tax=Halocalculus aciditolerans TaxID=1383812 RepID=A0A830F0A5_9EURY|nr:molybdopterin synthase [Halocalculus aciditolerans]GGL50147.1 molybdopterin synthase [Halocalculus aciditolerans]